MNQVLFRLSAFFLYLISLLPFWLLYILSDILYIFLYYLLGYRRKVVKTNLANSFPELSVKARAVIEKRFYKYLADMILESVKSRSITPSELKKRYEIENIELISSHLSAGRSVIAALGHYGNWEWGPIAIGCLLKEKVLVVYKPLSDNRFDNFINSIRSRFGAVMVPMKQTLRKITEYKNQPHLLVLVADQTPTREESKYFTNFLNQNTPVFLGLEKIGVKTNDPIVYVFINRIKRGYYKCTFKLLFEYPQSTSQFEITEAYTRELENHIRSKPEYWLWSHRRWKFSQNEIKQFYERFSRS